jgi:hypothetical protein
MKSYHCCFTALMCAMLMVSAEPSKQQARVERVWTSVKVLRAQLFRIIESALQLPCAIALTANTEE